MVIPLKKTLGILLAVSLILSLGACAAREAAHTPPEQLVSGGGAIEFSGEEEGPGPVDGEYPPAVEEDAPSSVPLSSSSLPVYSSSSISYPESSSSPASSAPASSQPSSASSEPEPEPEEEPEEEEPEEEKSPAPAAPDEVRGVWLSYLDLGPMLQNRSRSAFTSSIGEAFDQIRDLGLNTVFAQVRPFGDALYDSAYFPASYLFTGEEGGIGEAPYDALEIMVEEAHSRGLRIEAWINPYRVRANGNKALSDDNPAWDLLESGGAVRYDGGIYYDPGSEEARDLIVDGVREIVENYDVDGIHFDDYFYPAGAGSSFDAESYAASGSSMSLGNWRREQVNILVRRVYNAVGSDKVFGISPAGNNENNYSSLYCDVEEWLTNPGYVDYICPQVYFGFNNSLKPYKSTVREFNDMISQSGVKLYVGLAAYKIGDSQYGAEWASNTDIMARQVADARGLSRYGGFALYRYDSLFNPASGVAWAVEEELANLGDILD